MDEKETSDQTEFWKKFWEERSKRTYDDWALCLGNIPFDFSKDDIIFKFSVCGISPLKCGITIWEYDRTKSAMLVYKDGETTLLAFHMFHGVKLKGNTIRADLISPSGRLYSPVNEDPNSEIEFFDNERYIDSEKKKAYTESDYNEIDNEIRITISIGKNKHHKNFDDYSRILYLFSKLGDIDSHTINYIDNRFEGGFTLNNLKWPDLEESKRYIQYLADIYDNKINNENNINDNGAGGGDSGNFNQLNGDSIDKNSNSNTNANTAESNNNNNNGNDNKQKKEKKKRNRQRGPRGARRKKKQEQ